MTKGPKGHSNGRTNPEKQLPVLVQPQLQAEGMRAIVKIAVRAEVTICWRPEIIRTTRIVGSVILLRIIAGIAQVPVEQPRGKLICLDRRDRRHADEYLAALVGGGPKDRVGCNLGLIDRRHRLRFSAHAALCPIELWCVERGKMDNRHAHLAVIMDQFAAKRISEADHGMFGGAI